MIRILFVDDEAKILEGLQRMLRSLRHEWAMTFVESGSEALTALSAVEFDVIVSDMRMPGLSGAELLAEVRRRWPQIVRIILSGQSDQEHLTQLQDTPHIYLSKPCDTELLKQTVRQTLANRHAPP